MYSGLPLIADIARCSRHFAFVPYCDIRPFDVVNCLLVDGASKRQLSPTAQRLCDALNCLGTIRIGRGQFGELLEIRQRALQIVLSYPCYATVIERYCVVRVKPDRLVIILDGAVVLAFGFIGNAAVVEHHCVVRIKSDRLVIILNGTVVLALAL
jgi:hypothetical protein